MTLEGWDHRECVDSLIRKAGYRGHVDSTLRARLEVTRYQSSKCSLSFQEFAHMRPDLLPAIKAGDSVGFFARLKSGFSKN